MRACWPHSRKRGAFEQVVVVLAVMSNLPLQFVERSMTRDQSENLVVIAKAIGLSWSTVNDILVLRAKRGFLAEGEIVQRLERFNRLQVSHRAGNRAAASNASADKPASPK